MISSYDAVGHLRLYERSQLLGGLESLKSEAGEICGDILHWASMICSLSTMTGSSAHELKDAAGEMEVQADEMKAAIAKLVAKAEEVRVQEGLLRGLR